MSHCRNTTAAKSTSRRPLLLVLVGLVLCACDDGPDPTPDAAPADAAVDAMMPPPDAAPLPDAAPPPDAAPDAAPPDAGFDATLELDAEPDADLDAAPDVGPDAESDAEPDAERRDVGPFVRDAAAGDAVAPCTLFPCVCEPGAVEPCYDGPAETIGVGICVGGERTCAADGQGFGPCAGQQPPRGENCRTAEDEDCDGLTPDCTPEWLRTFAGVDEQAVRAVTVAPGGDVIAVLDFDDTVNLGAGPVTARAAKTDLGIARYDREGNPVWSRVFGDADNEFAARVVAGPAGEVVVLGRLYGTLPFDGDVLDSAGFDDILVMLLEPDGALRWARRFGGIGRDGAEALHYDGERILVAGHFEGQVRFGDRVFDSAGLSDSVALELDPVDGAVRFARQVGGAGADTGWGIAGLPDGGYVLGARFEQIVSFGGPPVQSAGGVDIALARFDAAGEHVWTTRLGGPGDEGLYGLVLEPDEAGDTLALFGWFEAGAAFGDLNPDNAGSRDFVVARLDLDGAVQAAVSFGDAADQIETPFPLSSRGTIALDPEGGLYLAGHFAGAAFGEPPLQAVGGADGFVARLDAELQVTAATGFGTLFTEMALDVALDTETGHLVLGGRYYSLIGPVIGPLPPPAGGGSSDGYICRISWPD